LGSAKQIKKPLDAAREALDWSGDRVASCDSCLTFKSKARRVTEAVDATCLLSRAFLVGDNLDERVDDSCAEFSQPDITALLM
jgi:hypothetical protein